MSAVAGDAYAVRGFADGGREGWERFAREYRRLVFKAAHAAARRFRAGAADVEDAVSQVFLELFEDDAKVLRSYNGRSTFPHWLTVVSYRIAARQFARRSRERPLEGEGAAVPFRPPDSEIHNRLSSLPDRERRALVLFHVEGYSYREIARLLEIPSNQVGMVLLRARQRLAGIVGGDRS